MLVPFRTAAAVSLLRASRIVTASAKCADDLSRCLLQLPETHAKVRASLAVRALRGCELRGVLNSGTNHRRSF